VERDGKAAAPRATPPFLPDDGLSVAKGAATAAALRSSRCNGGETFAPFAGRRDR